MASIDMLGAHSAWDNKYRILPIENSLYKLLQLFIPLVVILGLVDFSKATEGGGDLEIWYAHPTTHAKKTFINSSI